MLKNLICLLLPLLLAACGPDPDAPWERHGADGVSFELPADWQAVSDRRGVRFAPRGESDEKTRIEVRVVRNPRVAASKTRESWLRRQERSEISGNFVSARKLTVGALEGWELVQRSPAPSPELIPLEHQVAGDQTFHQVEIIGPDHLTISTHLLVEEPDYEVRLETFRRMLDSMRVGA